MISPISNIPATVFTDPLSVPASNKTGTFGSMLESYVGQVQISQNAAQSAVSSYLLGGTEEIHSVALATQRAELEFEMFLQVRNKVVQAYQEVMKTQV